MIYSAVSSFVRSKVLIETLWNVNDDFHTGSSKSVQVLIETLWNVNKKDPSDKAIKQSSINRNIVECKLLHPVPNLEIHLGINRNIVECKSGIRFICFVHIVVLIETLWNVNPLTS